MKQLITILTLVVIAISAFSQKVGHVNTQGIMVALPDYKSASDELERFAADKKKELEMFFRLYQESEQKLTEEAPALSDEIKQQRYQELVEKQQNIQSKESEFQQEIALKEQKLVEPIMAKIRAAITKIAKADGYSYVFDESTLLYFEGSDALDTKVKTELGVIETE